jgi:hypothetical protein
MQRIFISLFVTFVLIGCQSAQTPQTSTPTQNSCSARGDAVIFSNNISKAKSEALNTAFKECVQKAVGVFISTNSQVKDGELIYSKIVADSKGYIETYKITKEEQQASSYQVWIEAFVSKDKIESAFSSRLEAIISKNQIGPCTLGIFTYKMSPELYNQASVTCSVNDLSIASESIEWKLPGKDWTKAEVIQYGISKTIQYTWKGEKVNQSEKEISDLLLGKSLGFRFDNPGGSNKIKTETSVTMISGYLFDLPNKEIRGEKPVERNPKNTKLISELNGYFLQAMASNKSIQGICTTNLNISKNDDYNEYSVNFLCRISEADKKSLKIFPYGFNAGILGKSEADKTWLYFDSRDSFSLFCRELFPERKCLKSFLEVLNTSEMKFENSKGKGRLIFETLNCNIDSSKGKFNQENIKLSSSENDTENVRVCRELASQH